MSSRRPLVAGWVIAGMLGSALVAVLPFSVGYLPDVQRGVIERNLPWLRHAFGRYLCRVLALLGSALLFVAWLALRPRHGDPESHRRPWRSIALLWSLPFWAVPPVMTADPFAYAAQGWLLNQGRNPYQVAMGFPSPFTEGIYPAWLETTAVYPPLALQLQGLLVHLTGSDPYWSVAAMRLIALAGLALMLAAAGPLSRLVGVSSAGALWAIGLNPLLLVQLIGGSHNDALMIGLILVAFWVARFRGGLFWGAIVIGIATAVKQPAILAGPGVVWFAQFGAQQFPLGQRPVGDDTVHRLPVRWGRALGGLLVGGVIGGAVFTLLSVPDRLLFGWMGRYAGSPSLVINHSPLSWLAQLALRWQVRFGIVDRTLTVVSAVLILAAFVVLLRRFGPRRPIACAAGFLLAFGFLGPAMQPWYVLWGGPVLPFARPTARLVRWCLAVVLLLLLSGVLQEYLAPPIAVPLAALPAIAWAYWDRRRSARPAPDPVLRWRS